MDFDHVRGRKIKAVSRMVLDNAPEQRILAEIEKCDLVCVLCHNRRTQRRLDEKSPIKKYDKCSQRNIEIINRAKSQPCSICGETYESFNMHLDHVGQRTKYICQMKKYRVETLLAELKKCQVLCALCHRKKSISEQLEKFSEAC
jgi:hypothetical protein